MTNRKEAGLTSGLISHWPFDEGAGRTAADAAAGTSHPVRYVLNDARFTTPHDPQWRKGVKAGALLFDGYSTWLAQPFDVGRMPAEALTVTAWVAPRSYEWGDGQRLSAIINQHDKDNKQGYIVGMYRHGAWSLQLGLNGRWEEVWSYDEPLVKEQWSFIAATFDSRDGMMRLYLNGRPVAAKAVARVGITPARTDVVLGRNNQAVRLEGVFDLNMFNGLMDDVKLYGRALNEQEIAHAYEEDVRPHGGTPPALAYEDIRLDRSLLADDRHRPQYHVNPPAHWMNEPHAPIYYNGQYHLFCQHNPQGPFFHQIHWGHWVSGDMVHWRDLPIALAPEKDAVDPDGVWSGSAAYDEDGLPALFFTAGDDGARPNQKIALARSTFKEDGDNDLVRWVKHPRPLVLQPQGEGLTADFRDPFVWRQGGIWYMLVGSGVEGAGGTALAFVSEDMMNWTYKGHFYRADCDRYPYLGPIWELPVLLPLGRDKDGAEKHLFLVSPVGPGADVEVFYWIGSFDPESCSFVPDQAEPQLIDVGDFHFTGPSGMIDPKTGRAIVFTIAQGERTAQLEYDSGWAHNGGLPLHVYLREDGRLGIEPIEELQSLRGDKLLALAGVPAEEANERLRGIQGDMLEIRLELEWRSERGLGYEQGPEQEEEQKRLDAGRAGLKVRRSPGGEEETLVYYDYGNRELRVDRTKTTLALDERCKGVQGGKLELDGDRLRLHVYVDRSMIEVYANSLKSLTTRAYPSRNDALGLQIWGDGPLHVAKLEVWPMNSAWQS